ncbi:hypothetical protein, partial [Raoultella sp. 18110]|uniref:hypothetical protein n=1 Tax=Raoultella sp. 18110 TaxID=2681442 RepID=UPI00190F1212
RNAIYNAIALYRQPDGALRDDAFGFPKAETLLNLWALNAWHKKDEITPTPGECGLLHPAGAGR